MTVKHYDASEVRVLYQGREIPNVTTAAVTLSVRKRASVRRSFSPLPMTRKRARRTLRQWNRLRRLERVGLAEYPEAFRAIRDVRTGRSISAWDVFRAQCVICPRAWRCM